MSEEVDHNPSVFKTIRHSKWQALPVLVFIILGSLIVLLVLGGIVLEIGYRRNGMVVRPLRSQAIALSCFALTGLSWFYAAYAILKGRPVQGYSIAAAALVVTSLFYFVV